MENFNRILLQVWREACRDIEIEKSCGLISQMLVQHMPLEQVLLWNLDTKNRQIKTIAVGFSSTEEVIFPVSTSLSKPEWDASIRFLNHRTTSNARVTDEFFPALQYLFPDYRDHHTIIGPLQINGNLIGCLILVAEKFKRFDDKHRKMCEILLEPFSVAVQNDTKLKELKILREAAEADKKSLLVKLSREEMEDTIIGAEKGLKTVMERVDMVAKSDVPVLIFGETGTGKELISRAIHARSERSQGPFIRVNCGAIPSELIDSQLFGHEKGAFTGAIESRKGWFERADGGTLFLDEVGEMPLEAQIRLLRILQDGWMERVGGTKVIQVDVRVVLATHRDLASMVAAGKFREDLWYRISTFPIFLPPLRDRIQDMQALADHFAKRSAIRFGLIPIFLNPSDLKLLVAYNWPGNIRELSSVIDRAALLGNGKSLEIQKALGWGLSMETPHPPDQVEDEYFHNEAIDTLDQAMKRHIERALLHCGGRIEGKGGAAELLEINPHTLRGRMRKLGIQWSGFRPR